MRELRLLALLGAVSGALIMIACCGVAAWIDGRSE